MSRGSSTRLRPTSAPKLILASGSPRRRELLTEAGYSFEIHIPSPGAETPPEAGETPRATVERLAIAKAMDVASHLRQGLVLGCDTLADLDGHTLGKPRDVEDARRMLTLLSGRDHFVHSGVCLVDATRREPFSGVATTRLRMAPLAPREIEEYLESGLWRGKAGAFGLQDRHDWLRVVEGSESNVVGLPLELLARMLNELVAGANVPSGRPSGDS